MWLQDRVKQAPADVRLRKRIESLLRMPDYDTANTDLAGHYRSKQEASTQAEGVDLIGDSLYGSTIVGRPL